MKTILIEEPGKVVIEEHEKPVRKPGEVLLHMHHTQEFRDMSFRERLLRLMKMTED